ncbi:cellulase N-terminal Ig-like domain-containing protein [Parabacteroides pacaensis]|uniref:cellulase N-terminal Ig-like domain-containing protein n=1 Tax=Parabacteroides pacaensis TaxID=2086575 RepID=UPI00131A8543|nr:cellulase N-terminal Ig-like domain-containing protein [Parabacteroides pacaensis]
MKIFDKIQYTYILISLFVVVFFLAFTEKKAETSTRIRINQVGYYPYAENTAVITGKNTRGEFYIRDKITNKVVTKSVLSKLRKSLFTEKYRERPRGHPDEPILILSPAALTKRQKGSFCLLLKAGMIQAYNNIL